jgi:hypothetical protein
MFFYRWSNNHHQAADGHKDINDLAHSLGIQFVDQLLAEKLRRKTVMQVPKPQNKHFFRDKPIHRPDDAVYILATIR